ncbi:MAG: gliding motility lipoprotein GldB, partial [Flavobacteriaceae bacterium]|nr:gliding motility lipoprotein GldB [Flavobacteriaceae bacterium]
MSRYFYFLLLAILFFSCTKENKQDVDVSGIDVNFNVERFDQAYYTSKSEQLPALKEKFPYLFPVQTPDSIWIAKINDTDEQELFAESQKIYSDFETEKEELADLFKHIKYYYPAFKAPKVITLLSNVDYENRVVYADSLLLISLDNYLGSGNKIYDDFPEYIKNNFNRDRIVVDVAEAIGSDQ